MDRDGETTAMEFDDQTRPSMSCIAARLAAPASRRRQRSSLEAVLDQVRPNSAFWKSDQSPLLDNPLHAPCRTYTSPLPNRAVTYPFEPGLPLFAGPEIVPRRLVPHNRSRRNWKRMATSDRRTQPRLLSPYPLERQTSILLPPVANDNVFSALSSGAIPSMSNGQCQGRCPSILLRSTEHPHASHAPLYPPTSRV